MTQLVMFPYAGSIVNPYKEWLLLEEQGYKIIQMDYDGRGKRSAFERPATWSKLIESTLEQMLASVDFTKEYILFGHSMGARVAVDIYNKLAEMPFPQASCLIFSGTEVFHSKNYDVILSAPVEEFNQFFFEMGGISQEIIAEEELLKLVTDYLRADLILLNQFSFSWNKSKLTCPVLIFNGVDENKSEVEDWRELLGTNCEQTVFQGNHFFIKKNIPEIVTVIERTLANGKKNKKSTLLSTSHEFYS